MKTAILLPGQARFYKNNPFILDIKNKYISDLYIHTWERDDDMFNSRPNNKIPTFKISKEDIDNYIEMYSPTKFIIEKELSNDFIDSKFTKSDFSKTKGLCYSTKYNLYSYMYSLNRCLGLVDNIEDYDFFILVRCDMVNISFPDINTLDKNKMYIPIIKNHEDRGYMNSTYVDVTLSIMPPNFIKKHCELLNKIEYYYDNGYSFGWEEMFYANLFESGALSNSISLPPQQLSFELRRDETGIKRFRPF